MTTRPDPAADALAERLRSAADHGAPPLRTSVDDLVRRARVVRWRRVGLGAGALVAAAAAVTVAVVVPSTGDGARGSGGPASSPSDVATDPVAPTAPAEPTLPAAEVVRRCGPQLAAYDALPQYAVGRGARDRVLVHDRAYRVGDVVALHSGRRTDVGSGLFEVWNDNPVLCEVPAAGRESEPVPLSRYVVDDRTSDARVLELCAEAWRPEPGSEEWTDLRGGRLLARDRGGDVTTALVRSGDRTLECTLAPPAWDSVYSRVGPALRRDVALGGSTTGIKSLADDAAAYYYGAGTLPREVTRLRFTVAGGGPTVERPVVEGRWAVVIRVPGTAGLQSVTAEALAADGRVLDTWDAAG